jgi:RNA polymerase sigma-70 factor (ECF subfamily)
LLPFLVVSRAFNQPTEDLPEESYRLAKAGDLRAIESIVRHHQAAVRAWLAAHCPLGGDADDVAQRAFVAAITRLADFEVGTDFRAWLFSIARYQLMSEITRLRRLADYHSRLAPEILARELERRAQGPEERTSERLMHLRECVAAMGESARQFIRWRYDDQLPLEEMAARTGRSIGAIKKQLWLLRQKLQQCVEDKLAAGEEGAV